METNINSSIIENQNQIISNEALNAAPEYGNSDFEPDDIEQRRAEIQRLYQENRNFEESAYKNTQQPELDRQFLIRERLQDGYTEHYSESKDYIDENGDWYSYDFATEQYENRTAKLAEQDNSEALSLSEKIKSALLQDGFYVDSRSGQEINNTIEIQDGNSQLINREVVFVTIYELTPQGTISYTIAEGLKKYEEPEEDPETIDSSQQKLENAVIFSSTETARNDSAIVRESKIIEEPEQNEGRLGWLEWRFEESSSDEFDVETVEDYQTAESMSWWDSLFAAEGNNETPNSTLESAVPTELTDSAEPALELANDQAQKSINEMSHPPTVNQETLKSAIKISKIDKRAEYPSQLKINSSTATNDQKRKSSLTPITIRAKLKEKVEPATPSIQQPEASLPIHKKDVAENRPATKFVEVASAAKAELKVAEDERAVSEKAPDSKENLPIDHAINRKIEPAPNQKQENLSNKDVTTELGPAQQILEVVDRHENNFVASVVDLKPKVIESGEKTDSTKLSIVLDTEQSADSPIEIKEVQNSENTEISAQELNTGELLQDKRDKTEIEKLETVSNTPENKVISEVIQISESREEYSKTTIEQVSVMEVQTEGKTNPKTKAKQLEAPIKIFFKNKESTNEPARSDIPKIQQVTEKKVAGSLKSNESGTKNFPETSKSRIVSIDNRERITNPLSIKPETKGEQQLNPPINIRKTELVARQNSELKPKPISLEDYRRKYAAKKKKPAIQTLSSIRPKNPIRIVRINSKEISSSAKSQIETIVRQTNNAARINSFTPVSRTNGNSIKTRKINPAWQTQLAA